MEQILTTKRGNKKNNPIEVDYLDSSNSTGKNTPEVITLESTLNKETRIVEAEALATNETAEHEAGAPRSISDNPKRLLRSLRIWAQTSSQRGLLWRDSTMNTT